MIVNMFYNKCKKTTQVINLYSLDIAHDNVPAGYCSDGASVPAWLHWFCQPLDSRYLDVFIWHDYVYDHPHISRKQADLIMCDLLIERRHEQNSGQYNI